MQFAFVRQLNANFSDVIRALVIRGQALGFDAILLALTDAADIAHHVARHFTERILPEKPRLDLNAWQAIAISRDARNFFVGQPRLEWQAVVRAKFFQKALEATAITRRNFNDFRNLINGGINVRHFLWIKLQGVR